MGFYNQLLLKILNLLLCVIAYSFTAKANTYFQQQVNYNIDVTLNDALHELDGFATITYINNSPNTLNEILFHLYPNAYANDATHFAEQLLENGDTDFYFSKAEDKGNISNLSFKINNKKAIFKQNEKHLDLGKLKLNNNLLPGDSITITTPFTVKIPTNFSRLGRDGESYQITQWFPKPVVYDVDGWHPLPYLNQGEFYYEFGNYTVNITVPSNYIVAATGDLQTESELKFLNELAQKTANNIDEIVAEPFNKFDFPVSSETTKTLTFTQNNVHDFAWFADKRFHVLKSSVELESGKQVATWAYFTNKDAKFWKAATDYLDDSVVFYSKHVGEYPYNVCTAVNGTLVAGGGMEYPTITIIGGVGNSQLLDRVITHEVGHNWFQGILGSNERAYPYLDEGINSYYENRYMDEKYPDAGVLPPGMQPGLADFLGKQFNLENKAPSYQNDLGYMLSCRAHKDQPICTHSEQFTSNNYGIIAYGKAAIAFRYLEEFLGRTEYDRIMKLYYEQWQFKHPQPKDLRSVFESNTNKYLDWFFDEVLCTNGKMDYAITGQAENKTIGTSNYYQFFIKNKGALRSPFPITALKNDEPVKTIWYDGFGGMSEVLFPKLDVDEFVIDYDEITLDSHRKNNNFKLDGLFKKIEPLRLSPAIGWENPNLNQLFYLPMMSYNYWDGYMLGLGLHSGILPPKNLEWMLASMYSFKSKSVVGFGGVNYTIPLKAINAIENVELSISARSFHDFKNKAYSTNTEGNLVATDSSLSRFNRIDPTLSINLKKPNARSRKSNTLKLRHINILRKDFECPSETCGGAPFRSAGYYINELSFEHDNSRVINPYSYAAMAEQGDGFIKLSAEGQYKLTYINAGKGLTARAYAAYFPVYNNENNRIAINSLGYRSNTEFLDYKMDYWALARNKFYTANKYNLLDYQTFNVPSGFKSNTGLGINNSWLASINLSASIPKFPLYSYLNYAFFPDLLDSTKTENAYELGLALSIVPNVFEIYLPIAMSGNLLGVAREDAKYYEKITFLLDVGKLRFRKLLRNNI